MTKKKSKKCFLDQSAVIPFFEKNGEIMVVLVTSQKLKKWIFPKGAVEKNLSQQDSALKEAFEEAGLEGQVVGPPLGSFAYPKNKIKCKVVVFPMRVSKVLCDWPEFNLRQRKIVSLNAVDSLIDNSKLLKMFKLFKKFLEDFNGQ